MKFGNRIKNYLTHQNISQVQLSKMTGIPTSTLNDVLQNKTKLSTKNKQLIFKALNINEVDFYNTIKFEMINELFENHDVIDITATASTLSIHPDIHVNLSIYNKYTYNETDIILYNDNNVYYIDLYQNCHHRNVIGCINYIHLI